MVFATDLDGYIPTLGSKSRLIEACEAIERNETIAENDGNKKGKKEKGEKAKIENSGPSQRKEKEIFLYRAWLQPYA